MGSKLIDAIVSIGTAVIGIAIIAVLVSKSAQTGSVISSAGTAFEGILKAATSPITGSGGLSVPGL